MKNKDGTLTPGDLIRQLCSGVDDPLALPPVALVLAHPDDEVIGAGSRLPRLGGSVSLIYLTDGAPRDMRDARAAGLETREAYAAVRREELAAALSLAGIAMDQTLFIDLPDQEASLNLAALAHTLADQFALLQPGVVISHPYEGGHPDHDAAAFATQAACRLLRERGQAAPVPLEMTSYHRGQAGLEVFAFLPHLGLQNHTLTLAEEERQHKRCMMDCFVTQREVLRQFPVAVECYRATPHYDFTRPPHEGALYYETQDWGMDGARWRALAGAALQELGVHHRAGAAS